MHKTHKDGCFADGLVSQKDNFDFGFDMLDG